MFQLQSFIGASCLFATPSCLQILQQPDDDSGRETIVEQWDMQFDGVPPTHHLRTVSYDDEPTKIYKRMVRGPPECGTVLSPIYACLHKDYQVILVP